MQKQYENLSLAVDADGVAVICFDMPNRSMNVLAKGSLSDYESAIADVLTDPTIKGAVVTSGKKAFIAGADLDWVLEQAQTEGAERNRLEASYESSMFFQRLFRQTETCGKPFIAAINGTALGGGLELALGCSAIVVADDQTLQLGLPEAKVGLMPGAGGIARLVRLIGPLEALPYLLEGRSFGPAEALKMGVATAVVPPADLIATAKRMVVEATPDSIVKPWDRKGFVPPGQSPRTMEGSLAFAAANATLRKKTWGNYPALEAIMKAVHDGLHVPLDTALRIDSRQFARVMNHPTARNIVRTQFVNMQKVSKVSGRAAGAPTISFRKIGILGAGMMGSAIAHVSAMAGIDVVLIDRDQVSAEKGVQRMRDWHAGAVAKGRMAASAVDAIVARVTPTISYDELAEVDLVIEAVFEDASLKAEVTQRACAVMPPKAIFASNTSTLPITGLAAASDRPAAFVGLHFFSPVEKMQLVEIIRGTATSDETVAAALDFCRQIRRTPIVVNDSRGFYTSRVFATYTTEGCLMLAEGILPALIENAGRMAGMPVAPLALCDEISLDLVYKINRQTAVDLDRPYPGSPSEEVIRRMVEDENRLGRREGKGFYDYPSSGTKQLWPELYSRFPLALHQPKAADLVERLLTIQALEAARCVAEGVVARPEDADVGAILGWGFAPWTGGPISYIDTVGTAAFVQRCDRLAEVHGERFTPSDALRRMALDGTSFYAPASKATA